MRMDIDGRAINDLAHSLYIYIILSYRRIRNWHAREPVLLIKRIILVSLSSVTAIYFPVDSLSCDRRGGGGRAHNRVLESNRLRIVCHRRKIIVINNNNLYELKTIIITNLLQMHSSIVICMDTFTEKPMGGLMSNKVNIIIITY